ncbi:MAG: hypothetical protein ACSLFP_02165 [Acidimicrobiales bacterium]
MGWLERIFDLEHRRWSRHGDTADMAARASIMANSRNDQERARARLEAVPVPPVRWRWFDGRWQRWSELDVTFVDAEPPEGLVTHVEAEGGPVEDRELAFVDGAWVAHRPVDEEASSDERAVTAAPLADAASEPPVAEGVNGPGEPESPTVEPVTAAEPTKPAEPAEPAPASFEEQLARWRRRR